MKTLHQILIVAMSMLFISTLVWAREDGVRSKSFQVGKGGTVEVSTSVGDIRITTWEKNEVFVSVEGLDDEGLDKVKMTQSGNVVRVSYRSRWNDGSGHLRFEINVPQQFNLDMNTSGGDLIVKGDITGKIEGSTSGGDIKLENCAGGPVEVTTSGGDIAAGKIEGEGNLKTAGGDIRVGSVYGHVRWRYSSGDGLKNP
jgi:hypothetical protein